MESSLCAGDRFALALLAVLAALVILPIWWMFRSSLMTNAELYAYPPPFVPGAWRFGNYAATLGLFNFWKYFANTMTIIVPSIIGGTLTATLGGYAFARLRFPGKNFLFMLCVGSMLLPTMVTLIPLYIAWSPRPWSRRHVLAADSAVFLRRRRVQHIPDPAVHHDDSAGT